MSAVPPGANPTSSLTGRFGQAGCAKAIVGSGESVAPRAFRTVRLSIIASLSRAHGSDRGRERQGQFALLPVVEAITMPEIHRADDVAVPDDRHRDDRAAACRLDRGAIRECGA